MIKINLLAEEKRPAAVRRTKAAAPRDLGQLLLIAALLLGVLATAAQWWVLKSRLDAKDAEIREAQAEVDELAPIIKEVESYQLLQAELEHKISVINELSANQRGPVRVMDQISKALPELLWLTDMQMSSSTIQLRGKAFNNNAVASFTENLDVVSEFQEPDFKETKREGQVYNFSIHLGYQLLPVREAREASEAEVGGAPPSSTAAGAGG